MASIAKYAMMFTANASGVETGVRQAERSLSRMGGAAGSANSALGMAGAGARGLVSSLAGLAAGLVSVNALKNAFSGAVERIDELGDKAEGIGDTARNIEQLGYAAERLGSSPEAALAATTKMMRALGDAATGGGKAGDAIKALGLDLNTLLAMRPSEAMVSIASAISQLPNAYERAAVGADIFGKGSAELNSVLRMSGEEFAGYLERFDELNGGVGADALAAGSDVKDAMQDINTAYDGLMNAAVSKYGPAIAVVGGELANWIAKQTELANSAPGTTTDLEEMAQSARALGEGLSAVVKFSGEALTGLKALSAFVTGGFAAVLGAGETLGLMGSTASQTGLGGVNVDAMLRYRASGEDQAKDLRRRLDYANQGGTTGYDELGKDSERTMNDALDKYEGRGVYRDNSAATAAVAKANAETAAAAARAAQDAEYSAMQPVVMNEQERRDARESRMSASTEAARAARESRMSGGGGGYSESFSNDVIDNYGVPYFDNAAQDNNPQLAEQITYLRQIADNTANAAMVA